MLKTIKRKTKKVIIVFIVLLLLLLTACGHTKSNCANSKSLTPSDRFIIISTSKPTSFTEEYTEYIIEDTETGVLYLMIRAPYLCALTPLLNSDGTPMLKDAPTIIEAE